MRSPSTASAAAKVLRAIAALVGPGNRWITGQRTEVSGGLHL